MDPVENMVRCMANNYSAAGFWRGWHRSYNQWLIRWVLSVLVYTQWHLILTRNRYIYIPIGGRGSGILATILVFTFVALWHDLTFKLLAWGWLISLFILPEMLLTRAITREEVSLYQRSAEAALMAPPRSLVIDHGIDMSVH